MGVTRGLKWIWTAVGEQLDQDHAKSRYYVGALPMPASSGVFRKQQYVLYVLTRIRAYEPAPRRRVLTFVEHGEAMDE
jgi:hypothetical protein